MQLECAHDSVDLHIHRRDVVIVGEAHIALAQNDHIRVADINHNAPSKQSAGCRLSGAFTYRPH